MFLYIDIETAGTPVDKIHERRRTIAENLVWSRLKAKYQNEHWHYPSQEAEEGIKLDDWFAWIVDWFIQTEWAFHPALSQLLCVTVGYYDTEKKEFKTKSYSSPNEEDKILFDLESIVRTDKYTLVGHNILWFDLPYLIQKYISRWIPVPKGLDVRGKKPRDVKHKDTMLLWKMTGRKNSSLQDICLYLWMWDPKEELKGSEITSKRAETEDSKKEAFIEEVVKYCEKDVEAVYKVFERITS